MSISAPNVERSELDPYLAAIGSLDQIGYQASDRAAWLESPLRWAQERAQIGLWSKQCEIMEAVRDYPKTAVHSCHSAGKTYTAAAVIAWWIDTHPPGTAFAITTAPTGAQVKAILWREINRLHAKAALPGRTNLTEWYLENEMVAFGRKPSDHSESNFHGIHAKYVLVVLDEACGIPKHLWVAAEAIASNRHSRILAIGNPDSNDGQFAQVCKPESGWLKIHIAYWHTPNFTDEVVDSELRDVLVAPEWIEDKKLHWGEDSALFQSKCLGQFPPKDADPWAVVPYGQAAQCRWVELAEEDPVEAGIDVGAGGDRTVIRERRGPVAGREDMFRSNDPMATVGQLVACIKEWGVQRVKVDVIGIGWGIYGRLRELSSKHTPNGERAHDAELVPINFAEKSMWPRRFANLRAEVWWQVGRELSRNSGWDLRNVDDDLLAELTAPRYEIADSVGKIKIEPKDKVRERLSGLSPDRAEALLLAFYDGKTAGKVNMSAVETFRSSGLSGGSGGSRSPFGNGSVTARVGAGLSPH